MKTLLQLDDVHAGYGPIDVLKGVAITVNEGEIVTVLGANGAGKSTMLMTISGINRCREGQISFAGRPIQTNPPMRSSLGEFRKRRKAVAFFSRLTVRENLEMGAFQREDQASLKGDLETRVHGVSDPERAAIATRRHAQWR